MPGTLPHAFNHEGTNAFRPRQRGKIGRQRPESGKSAPGIGAIPSGVVSSSYLKKGDAPGKTLLSCSVVARSPKETSYDLVGHPVTRRNLAKGFVVLKDTVHPLRPFLRGSAPVRLLWTWTLLCGEERGHTAKQLFVGEESLMELAVRVEKVDQHW